MTTIRELSSPRPMPLMPSAAAQSQRPTQTASPGAVSAAGEEPSAFGRLMRGLSRESDAGEATMHRVLDTKGPALDTHGLLALQASIYRYGETIDLASRLVDKASSSVKTVLQGQ